MSGTGMVRSTLIAVSFLLGAALWQPLHAQVSRADSAAVLVQAARELNERGDPDAAQALLRLVLDRFGDTPSAPQARADLGLVETSQSASSGRVELQVWGALYGLYAGLTIPAAADAEGPEAYGLGLLLGGPAGFLAASSYSRSRPLTTGQARAITLGGTWGSWQGWGWANVADLGETLDCFDDVCFVNSNGSGQLWASLAGGAAGIVAGAVIARRPISPGLATTANFGALWGSWFGLAGGIVADLEDDELLAATLLAGNAGLLSSALLGRGWNFTRSRARLISIAGVLGGLAGGGIDLIANVDDQQTALAIPLATSIVGLAIGAAATRNRAATTEGASDALQPGAFDDGLFTVSDGALRLGLPMPTPDRLLLSEAGRDRSALTHRIKLLQMRF